MIYDKKNNLIIEQMSEEISIPGRAYKKAIKHYEDLRNWLNRNESSLKKYKPQIFVQGSFQLGTAIKPLKRKNQYDLDLVCKLKDKISKTTHSQADLKEMIRKELNLYKINRGIEKNLQEKPRCWRLEYQDDLNFRMDILPCIPESDKIKKDILLSIINSGVKEDLARSSSNSTVSITCELNCNYRLISDDWNISNPEGYVKWFKKRMNSIEKQVDSIPLFINKTPLQRVIQLLKRHRDNMFANKRKLKPISIILTTLATKAYSGEQDIYSALKNILKEMWNFANQGTSILPNPVNPRENFADKWSMPEYKKFNLKKNFCLWLEQLQNDLSIIENSTLSDFISEQASKKFGINLDEKILEKESSLSNSPSLNL
ncbi:MAG: nucleotidyltransferase [Bdellovibrionales bacterium]|nr:nucleotidyltransferase [Bdellovibrionales bacterium]